MVTVKVGVSLEFWIFCCKLQPKRGQQIELQSRRGAEPNAVVGVLWLYGFCLRDHYSSARTLGTLLTFSSTIFEYYWVGVIKNKIVVVWNSSIVVYKRVCYLIIYARYNIYRHHLFYLLSPGYIRHDIPVVSCLGKFINTMNILLF